MTNTGRFIQNQTGENSLPTTVISVLCCKACGQSKPKKEFLKRLTLAQTKAFLNKPDATTRFTTSATTCRQCRAKNRRTKPLTQKQIRSKISSGDMNKTLGEMRIEQIKRAIPKKRSRVMKEYWQKKKAQPHGKLKDSLQQQVAKYQNRYAVAKHQQHARLPQYRYEYEEARRIRDELMKQKYEGAVDVALLIKPYKPNQGE